MILYMSRTHVRRRRPATLLVGLGLAASMAAPARLLWGAGPEPVARRSYVVRPGDTLWSIAERIGGGQADPRPLVAAMASTNRVSPGALVPGETLILPPRA